METIYDYKRYAILYVDDEDKSLKYFALAFADRFRILTAPNAAEGFALLQQHKDEIAVLMTDQRMPGEKGVQLLERSRHLNPRIIRILATAYSDLEAAIQAVVGLLAPLSVPTGVSLSSHFTPPTEPAKQT